MDIIWAELSAGIPDTNRLIVLIVRLVAAGLMGAAIGFEREKAGKTAGLRTHILVATGTTAFILGSLGAGMDPGSDGMSRVIQGIITGIGFVGAGTILKRESAKEIEGVTTSAGIWMTAAIGVTIGLGGLGLAILATILALLVLRVTLWFETRSIKPEDNN